MILKFKMEGLMLSSSLVVSSRDGKMHLESAKESDKNKNKKRGEKSSLQKSSYAVP